MEVNFLNLESHSISLISVHKISHRPKNREKIAKIDPGYCSARSSLKSSSVSVVIAVFFASGALFGLISAKLRFNAGVFWLSSVVVFTERDAD